MIPKSQGLASSAAKRSKYAGEGRRALLTAEQECQLSRSAIAGDRDARDCLVQSNLGLVRSIASEYQGGDLDLEDLIGEGNLGLFRAVAGFDPDMQVRFSTYAGYWIREAIRRALINTGPTIRLPKHMAYQLKSWRRAKAALSGESGRPANPAAVAGRLGLSPVRQGIMEQALLTQGAASGGASSGSFQAVEELGDGRDGPAESAEQRDNAGHLRKQMATRLDERERAVLTLRFGLDDGEPLTLREVGTRLGISRESVSKIEAKAVKKLRG